MSEAGMVTVDSSNDFVTTLARLQAALRAKGVMVFALFDHAAGAAEAGLALRPTTVVVFGNPAAGTQLMQANQLAGIDLPLKVLVWQDADGTTRLGYHDPHDLVAQFALGTAVAPAVDAMAGLVAAVVQQAADR